MMNGGGMGGGFFGTGFLFILLIIAILGVFVWMMRAKTPKENNQTPNANRHSLSLLKGRLAKGEITEEEYERLKRKIQE
ncbi:SHOCT domain-containing protein [Rossellomorea vietnamensis]|uniref:SHOCT domain-containing protein n=1 Tax=Rossellomorea vietnamensis TaxID=218284 RepID=UPI00309088AB|nr:SHOCT domain-containing protein [Rossellomorea vietnamensis]